MDLIKQTGKLNFTSTDVENNLYHLAITVMDKATDPTKVNSAISAYNALIKLEALKMKAEAYANTKPAKYRLKK